MSPLTSCKVNVQPQLLQDDLPWAPEIYDSTSNTIAQKGCGLTSLTMALHYAGLQKVDHTSLNLDPGNLNAFMNADEDYSGASVNWAPTTRDASDGVLIFDTLGGSVSSASDSKAAAQALTSALCAPEPHPVIVGVTSPSSGIFPGHFVLVTGVQSYPDGSQTFTIDDPFYPFVSLSDYNNIYVTRGIVRDPSSNISELDFSLGNGADLLVTDPTGAQTGYLGNDADTQGIKNSAHFVDSYGNDVTSQAPSATGHFVDIFQPNLGNFSTNVVGLTPGIFELRIRAFSTDGSSQPALSVSGISGLNSSTTFQIHYLSVIGSTPAVTLIATFQSTLEDISNSRQLGLMSAGIAQELSSSVQTASLAASQGNNKGAEVALGFFEQQVTALSGTSITGIAPQVLQADATSLLTQLGGFN